MNALLVQPSEVTSGGHIRIVGERARAVGDHHPLEVGGRLRIAVLGQFRGHARVEVARADLIELVVEDRAEPLDRVPLTLLVAIPRPQTVKKVVSLAVQSGVERLIFVKSFLTVPSYLQSHSLRAEQLNTEVGKGLEQVWDCTAPQIEVFERMGEVFESLLPQFRADHPEALFLLGETPSERTCAIHEALRSRPFQRAILGIGPESGWSPGELEGFARAGFVLAHLGERHYRVETALALFIGHFQSRLAQVDHRAD